MATLPGKSTMPTCAVITSADQVRAELSLNPYLSPTDDREQERGSNATLASRSTTPVGDAIGELSPGSPPQPEKPG